MTDKLKWTQAKVRLGSIKAWAGNPRYSTRAQAQRLIDSERKFGQPLPFLLSPEVAGEYPLLDGHQRLAAWLTVYGAEHVVVAAVANRALTETEHRELVVTLHEGAQGSWNWDELSSWDASDLQAWGMDALTLKEWNTDALNLKELLGSEVEIKLPGEKPQQEPELESEVVVVIHCSRADLEDMQEVLSEYAERASVTIDIS